MLSGFDWTSVGIMVLGAVLIFSGISNLSDFFRLKRPGSVLLAEVFGVDHRSRRDDKGRLIQNYYELHVRYKKDNRIIPAVVESTTEYLKGETVRVTEQGRRVRICEPTGRSIWIGILLALSGVCFAAGPWLMKRFGEGVLNYDIAAVFAFMGFAALVSYKKENPSGLIALDGTVTELLLYQTDKERRRVIAPKNWYPLISYEYKGVTRAYLSRISSAYESSFKVGGPFKLYLDPETNAIVEKKPGSAMLIVAVLLLGFAAYGLFAAVFGGFV